MSLSIPEFLLNEEVFSLQVSIEATMLYILDRALTHGGDWPDLLYAYPWFPKGLKGLVPEKSLARLPSPI